MDQSQIAALPLAEKAAIFIRAYEGFTDKAMWDVNAYRIGHGSDTITNADGTFRKVKEHDTTTREAALRDLMRRIRTEFIPRLQNQLGSATYNALPWPAIVGLLSLSYNYGSITKQSIITAARTLDTSLLADTVINATYNDNKSQPVNVQNELHKRRAEEAAFIRMGKSSGSSSGVDLGIVVPVIAIASLFAFKTLQQNKQAA